MRRVFGVCLIQSNQQRGLEGSGPDTCIQIFSHRRADCMSSLGPKISLSFPNAARRPIRSEPTVIRFCSAIGCDGFRDMRVKLASSLAFAHTAISSDDDLSTIVTKVFDYNLSNLNWSQSHLDIEAFDSAVRLLSKARRIEFFGFGASGIVSPNVSP